MRFVIVIDMQEDFVAATGALPVPDAEAIVAPTQAWLAALDPAGTAGVLLTFDTHVPEIYAGSPESEAFPPHCVRGTPGWASVLDAAAIDPAIPVHTLEKGVFDMWEEPGVTIRHPDGTTSPREAFFAALKAQGVERVAVIGVAADYCVRWAVAGLLARGFAVEVPARLTRGIARSFAQVAAEEFAGQGVSVVD